MRKFKEAEEMYIKAIQIRKQLLGQEDNEVTCSVGYLASLSDYDMNQYENAEILFAIYTHREETAKVRVD